MKQKSLDAFMQIKCKFSNSARAESNRRFHLYLISSLWDVLGQSTYIQSLALRFRNNFIEYLCGIECFASFNLSIDSLQLDCGRQPFTWKRIIILKRMTRKRENATQIVVRKKLCTQKSQFTSKFNLCYEKSPVFTVKILRNLFQDSCFPSIQDSWRKIRKVIKRNRLIWKFETFSTFSKSSGLPTFWIIFSAFS